MEPKELYWNYQRGIAAEYPRPASGVPDGIYAFRRTIKFPAGTALATTEFSVQVVDGVAVGRIATDSRATVIDV